MKCPKCNGRVLTASSSMGTWEPDEEPFKDGELIPFGLAFVDAWVCVAIHYCIDCNTMVDAWITEPGQGNDEQEEIDRLHSIIRQLLAEDNNHWPPIPYAIEERLANTAYECRYCEHSWEAVTLEKHADNCPVTLGRAAIEEDGT